MKVAQNRSQVHAETGLRGRGPVPVALLLLLALQAGWGGWFIFQTSFLIDGERTFCLYDDAMISMTFARNWLEGHGVHWARWGDPVEGFTNPMWTYGMAIANALPLELRLRSLPVQVASLLFLLWTTVASFRVARRHFTGGASVPALAAAVLTATTYPLHHWALRGFSMGLVALLMVVAIGVALDVIAGEARVRRLFVVVAIAGLVRMDALLIGGVVLGFVVFRGGFRARERRDWLIGAAVLVGTQLAYEGVRLLYFGDPLPNPFYLKLTGVPLDVRWTRGLDVLAEFATPLLAPVAIVAIGALTVARSGAVLLAALLAAAWCGYSVHAGGDAWEHSTVGANRFLCLAMPPLSLVVAGVHAGLSSRLGRWGDAGSILLIAWLFVAGNRLVGEGAVAHRRNLLVADPPHAVELHRSVVEETLALVRFVPSDARVSVVWAGIPAYFSDFEMVDFLGFSDRHIARLPPAEPLTRDDADRYQPGHMKWDLEFVLAERRPDVVYQQWPPRTDRAELFERYGYVRRVVPVGEEKRSLPIWVRRDSDVWR